MKLTNPLSRLQCAHAVYVETAADDEAAWDKFNEAIEEYFAVMEETANPYEAACIKFLEAGAMMYGENDYFDTVTGDKWEEAVKYHELLKGV